MYNVESENRRFYAVAHTQEATAVTPGSLIPSGKFSYAPRAVTRRRRGITVSATMSRTVAMILLIGAVASTSWVTLDGRELIASVSRTPHAPTVIIEHPYTGTQTPLNYGVNVTFTEPNFFAAARAGFIDTAQTFIEVNISTMQLRLFENGVLALQVPILATGQAGSWWETPAGLYEVVTKKERLFSTIGQVYTPWTIGFQGNFFIHGWPTTRAGEPVPADYSGGGIRLSDADAAALYERVTVATPVLVYEHKPPVSTFVYEPKIPELATPHYLIADIESSTVLASSDLSAVAPIASITKLMTALVAAESLNLDSTVNVTTPTFVQSLVPRLGERSRVSMYSLMQLLLVESSNEASEVIATQLGRAEFIARMNDKAKAIGMADSAFADPSGLSSDNLSTVRDLLRLMQYIAQNRGFIIDLTRDQDLATSYVGGEFGTLTNFNTIVGTDNFIGGKIGETSAAGQTSATLHTISVKGEERVVAIIILGSSSRDADVLQLLNYAEERFSY